jgi:hypothetical protein
MTNDCEGYFINLNSHLKQARAAIDRLFVEGNPNAPSWVLFFDILDATARLYCDYTELLRIEPSLPILPEGQGQKRPLVSGKHVGSSYQLIRREIERASIWKGFQPTNEFRELNQLHTTADYKNTLALHLSGIYGEFSKLEPQIERVLTAGEISDYNIAELVVGLQHAAHHISYSRYALEILAQEDNWEGVSQDQAIVMS